MKITNKEPNYCATIIKIHSLVELEGSHSLIGLPVFGMQALVSKDHTVGEVGIIFPTECQLSHEFCFENNLYRDKTLNKDTTQKGYIEANRRVKACKFISGRHVSNALFMPLSSLNYLGIDTNQFKEGDSFTHINDKEICRKYVIKQANERGNKVRSQNKRFERINNKLFPEYIDTDNYFRNRDRYKDDDEVVVSLKLHGTSGRFTNQKVLRKLSRFERLLKFCGVRIDESEYDCLAGSRRVIKDTKTEKVNDHYYEEDLWNQNLAKIAHLIPKNVCLYVEIVGWVGDSPIQKNYTYQIPKGQNRIYVYRITNVNEDGFEFVWSWDQMAEWCEKNGLNICPVMWRGKHKDFRAEDWMNIKYWEAGFRQALPLDPNAPCDEGVVIRGPGLSPYVTKAKSPEFLEHETKQLDAGIVDMESFESLTEIVDIG